MEEMDNHNNDVENCTPPDIIEAAQATSLKLLPEKSRARYEHCYDQFIDWRRRKEIKTSFSENVLLAYINELSNKLSPPSLWTQYSMLKSTLYANHNVDISKYNKVKAFLKRMSDGYKPKKAKTLTAEEINKFITMASDDQFLFEKVTLIMGISGACRKQELVQLLFSDIEDLGSAAIVYIRNSKNKTSRSFNIAGDFYTIYKKYAKLRPSTNERRFFLNYRNKKCTQQVVGINKIGCVPRVVARFLKLNNPELYTGHTFRRSSATILVDAGGSIETLKRHGGWKSSSVAEGYIDDSAQKRTNISSILMEAVSNSTANGYKEEASSTESSISENISSFNRQRNLETVLPLLPPPETNQIISNETFENNLHNAPIQFTHCSGNQFTFNFYAEKKN